MDFAAGLYIAQARTKAVYLSCAFAGAAYKRKAECMKTEMN